MAEPAFLGFHFPLLSEERTLDRPQQGKRQNKQQWDCDKYVYPDRRLVGRLNPKDGTYSDNTGDQHDEPGSPVAGIGKIKGQSAICTRRRYLQVPRKQLAAPAARASPEETGLERREIGIVVLVHQCSTNCTPAEPHT